MLIISGASTPCSLDLSLSHLMIVTQSFHCALGANFSSRLYPTPTRTPQPSQSCWYPGTPPLPYSSFRYWIRDLNLISSKDGEVQSLFSPMCTWQKGVTPLGKSKPVHGIPRSPLCCTPFAVVQRGARRQPRRSCGHPRPHLRLQRRHPRAEPTMFF